jgi:tetratricopeptide (TPR) repeat protein
MQFRSVATPALSLRLRATVALCLSFFAFGLLASGSFFAHADEQMAATRLRALQDMSKPAIEARRAAVVALAEVGIAADAEVLLQALRDGDEDVRSLSEQALWKVWSRSGDSSVDSLFRDGVAQMIEGNHSRAIATFSTIIERRPDFAEAWNKRATLYFIAGEYAKSLKDCDETLKRNPNHFGAMEGFGQIYIRMANPEKALEYFQRAFDINPNLPSVQRLIDELDKIVRARHERAI